MTALSPLPVTELSCRNDASAAVGDRVVILEWSDTRRVSQGRVAVPADEAAGHALRLAGPGWIDVRPVGDGVVVRVIQWLRVGGQSLPARVVVRLDGAALPS